MSKLNFGGLTARVVREKIWVEVWWPQRCQILSVYSCVTASGEQRMFWKKSLTRVLLLQTRKCEWHAKTILQRPWGTSWMVPRKWECNPSCFRSQTGECECAPASFKSSTEDVGKTGRRNYEKAKGTRRGFCLIGVSGMAKKDLKAQSLGN